MLRIATFNLNHRTHAKPIPFALIEAIVDLDSDILVLTEFVEGHGRGGFRAALHEAGLRHTAVSETSEYVSGRWHNQVLIASNDSLKTLPAPAPAPTQSGSTNALSVQTHGLTITGVRVPMFKRRPDWYAHWDWLTRVLSGDLVIGDFNADPDRSCKADQVMAGLEAAGGWIVLTQLVHGATGAQAERPPGSTMFSFDSR